jgi:voltage-gated potassium channel
VDAHSSSIHDAPDVPRGDSDAVPARGGGLKRLVYDVLHTPGAGGRAGAVVEALLLCLIALNIVLLALETVRDLEERYGAVFFAFEAASVAVFTAEYLLRLWSCTVNPRFASPVWGRVRYALTPMALVDLLAILPFYLPKSGMDLRVLRALRLMRIFRVAKVWRYSAALHMLGRVFVTKREQLLATLFTALLLVVVASTLMYYVEHDAQPDRFSSVPAAMWWGIATITTIGYGDMYPVTPWGKVLASVIAVLGIGLFALPTAILGTAFIEELQSRNKSAGGLCPHCGKPIKGEAQAPAGGPS